MVEKRILVISGRDFSTKKKHIEEFKKALSLHYPSLALVNLFSQDISLFQLQKEMENISFSKRLFIFRNSEKLSPEIKDYLKKIIGEKRLRDFLIFDFDLDSSQRERMKKDRFFSFLFRISPPFKTGGGLKDYTFSDLRLALVRGLPLQALEIIDYLLKKGRKERISLQILGLMVKVFVDSAPSSLKSRNLKYIFEIERLIKEGKISFQLALELLVFKLLLKQRA